MVIVSRVDPCDWGEPKNVRRVKLFVSHSPDWYGACVPTYVGGVCPVSDTPEFRPSASACSSSNTAWFGIVEFTTIGRSFMQGQRDVA